MSYQTNNLEDLCIRSALIEDIKISNGAITLVLNEGYIPKGNEANPSDSEILVESVEITLNDVELKSAKFFGYTDKNTNNIVPDLFMDYSNFTQDLLKMLEYYPELFGYKKSKTKDWYTFTVMYSSEVVDLTLSFSGVLVECDVI
jgi:hypothetical protein